ncbi:MAG: gliding motility-associated C-terminal domain-containing protein [Crocinitomicaceae bacterium]
MSIFKPILILCTLVLFINRVNGQTLTCPEFTATGTSSSPYIAPSSGCPTICPQALTSSTYPWDGGTSTGKVIATSIIPTTSLSIAFFAVNTNDYATITVNGGGTVSLTGSGVGISGNVIGPTSCGTLGDVFVTIHSTLPFTVATISNTGGGSGWVISCPGTVPHAGLDNTYNPLCGGTLDLNTLLSGADGGGVWSETSSSGQFNTTTGVLTGTGLAPGTYTFQYTVTSCGFVDVADFTVTVGLSLNPSTVTNASCGNSDGAITINTNGGVAPFQYSIDNGVTFQSGNSFTGLAPNTYHIVVTDNGGCSVNATVAVNVSGAASIDNLAVTPPTCATACDGKIVATVSGGTLPYTYQWFDASHTAIGTNSATITGLCAGNYSLEIGAGTGGTTTTIYSENFNAGAPTWTLNVPVAAEGADPNFFMINDDEGGVLPPGCGVASNGDPTLHVTSVFNPSGGAAYDAGGGCGFLYCPETHRRAESGMISTVGQTGLTLSFDFIANGDIPNDQATVWYNTGLGWTQLGGALSSGTSGCAPQGKWTVYSSPLPVACENIANLQVAIRWDNNDDGVGTDPSVAINNILITKSTGGGGCPSSSFASLTTPIISITSVAVTAPTCGATDGSIVVSASGGTGTLNFSSNNGTTTQTSGTFSGLVAGSITISVIDGNGCQKDTTVNLIAGNAPVIDAIVKTNPSACGGTNGSIVITASGGVGTLNYSIDNGVTFQTSNTFNNLAAGNYPVVVKDANGCSVSVAAILVGGPAVTISNINSTSPSCGNNNGSISVSVSGGTPNFSYSINNGVNYTTTSSFSNLGSGSYFVIVKDLNGCTDTSQVLFAPTSAIQINNLQLINETCGAGNGSATVITSGGTSPYNYSLNGGTTQPSNLFSGLSSGYYTFQIKDQLGCVLDSNFTILNAPGNLINIPDQSLCGNQYQINGTTVSGGIWSSDSPYISFSPDSSQLNPLVLSDTTGVFTITYTNAACGYTNSFKLTFVPYPYTQILDTLICSGESYQINALNMSQNKSYLWSTGENGTSITINQEGVYYVTAFNDCGQSKDSCIISAQICNLEVPNVFTPNNDGSNDYFKLLYAIGVNQFSCIIVNRWGNPIRSFDNASFEWNGTDESGQLVAEGVYFYIIKAKTFGGTEIKKQGFVQLVKK